MDKLRWGNKNLRYKRKTTAHSDDWGGKEDNYQKWLEYLTLVGKYRFSDDS